MTSDNDTIKVMVVDDIPEARDTLGKFLMFEDDIKVIAEAGSGQEAIDRAIEFQPDVILMDINMPDMDGITATQIINQQVVTSKVIILSVQDDKDQMHRALEAGAREYLTKPITPEELTDSIRFVCNPPSATIATKQDAIPTTPSHPQSPKPDPLSPESIFISYKRTDWDTYVGPLVERLRTAGLSIWVDQHRLVTGKDWFDQINLALTTCERMILCVSPDALQSRHVKVEYRYFFNKGKPLYPLICRPTELPPELFSLQYYEYTHIEQLIALLKADSRH